MARYIVQDGKTKTGKLSYRVWDTKLDRVLYVGSRSAARAEARKLNDEARAD